MIVIPGVHLTLHAETIRFLGSCLLGIPIGLLLECFRTLRACLPHHCIAVFLEDALFSFGICFLLQCYAWMFAEDVLRWYHAAGAMLGFAVWLLTVGAVWRRMLCRFRRFRRKLYIVLGGNTKKNIPAEKFAESP
ncbi:MAG TPA: hypothetical protein DCG49_11840 [Ruminococcus sp.]|nr:hypothetical protein [Ruminococcus sp.]